MKQPKIALIEVSSGSTHVFSKTYLPRVGLASIGAVLAERGYDCTVWFQALSRIKPEQLKQYDIVGIGSLTNTVSEAYRIAEECRKNGAYVVLGGPHVTFALEEALMHCDYVVLGEGEETFPALVKALTEGGPLDTIKGLAYRHSNGEVHFSPPELVDFSSLPSPNWSLSPQYPNGKVPPIVITSRGCPHNCGFCVVKHIFGRRYRYKSNHRIIDELQPILHQSVCFGDDNFFADTKRTKELLREMIAKNSVPRRWSAEMPVGAAKDEELLGLMRKTRCRIVYVGIESVQPQVLKKYSKAHQAEDIEACIANLHRYGIGIHGMFVVGLDDNSESVREIVDFAIANEIDSIQISSLVPFPGTESYEEYKDRLLHRDWKYFDGMHVVVEPFNCSPDQMQLALIRELQRFYSLRRVVFGYRRGRGWRVKYRLGGYYLTRKWKKENKNYLQRLQSDYYL